MAKGPVLLKKTCEKSAPLIHGHNSYTYYIAFCTIIIIIRARRRSFDICGGDLYARRMHMSHCHSVTIPSPSLTSSFQSLFRNFCCRFPCCIYRILGLLYHGQSFMVRALFVVNVSLCRSRGGVPVSLSRVALGVLRSSRDFLEASILDFLKWSEVCFGWLLDGWIALASSSLPSACAPYIVLGVKARRPHKCTASM